MQAFPTGLPPTYSFLTLPAQQAVQRLCNGRMSVRLSVSSTAAAFRSISVAGARAQRRVFASPGCKHDTTCICWCAPCSNQSISLACRPTAANPLFHVRRVCCCCCCGPVLGQRDRQTDGRTPYRYTCRPSPAYYADGTNKFDLF